MIAFAWILILGFAAVAIIDPEADWPTLLGSAFLLGSGIVALILMGFSIAGRDWTLSSVNVVCLIVFIALAVPAFRRFRRRQKNAALRSETRTMRAGAVVFDVSTLVLVIAHGAFATVARLGAWDFWAIWGLKGRVFFEHRGIDWPFLENPYYAFSHPDYPPLLPLNDVFLALHDGMWSDRSIGLLTTLFAAALLLIVRGCLSEELPSWLAAAGTFGLASIALTQWVGMAEAPMMAFGTAALLLLRRSSFSLGAVLLGFAALTKNEGLSLLVAVIVAMFFFPPAGVDGERRRWRSVLAIWPALAIAAPWLALRALHVLPTDLASGPVSERAARQILEVFRVLFTTPLDRPLFWVAVLATLVFAKVWKRERFFLAAIVLQFLFFVAAYIVTPNEVRWHIVNSWPRLLDQLAMPLGFLALTLAGRFFGSAGGNLWTVVVDSGTNRASDSGKRQRGSTSSGTQRTHGAQPREDRREGAAQGPVEFPQDH